MGITARVTVLAPDDVLRDYGALALVRLERAATQAGAYAEVATQVVESRKFSYEIFHDDGVPSDWYRSRFSTATPTLPEHYSGYTDPFSPSQPQAYATLDDLLITKRQDGDTRYAANAERRLVDASRQLDQAIGYGVGPGVAQTLIVDGDGSARIHIHSGFTAVGLIEVRSEAGGAWTALEAEGTGWVLEGAPGRSPGPEEPYFHIALLPTATYARFPRLRLGVRLTDLVPGWPAIPATWRAATVAWARQAIDADPLGAGSVQSEMEQSPFAADRKPQAVFDLITAERHRHWCYL